MDTDYCMTLKYRSYGDDWMEDEHSYEELFDNSGNSIYRVNELSECPEDAVIWRDLTSAYEIVDIIKFGMWLYKMGYRDIKLHEVKVQ